MSSTDPYQQQPQAPYGQAPQGQPQAPYGQAPYGQAPYGQAPYAAPVQRLNPTGFFGKLYQGEASPAPKSFMVAALLAFFLGGIGAVDFYLGYKKVAIIKLIGGIGSYALLLIAMGMFGGAQDSPALATVGGLFVLLGLLVSAVVGLWVFVSFIFVLIKKAPYNTDANGQPLAS